MPRYSTPNKLLRFVYDETTTEENRQVIDKVHSSAKAQDLLDTFLTVKEDLDQLVRSPRQEVLDRIMTMA